MGDYLFTGSVEDAAQADGAQTISLEGADRFREHQIQVEVSATPSAGTLTVAFRTPGASEYVDVGTIDLTDSEDYLQYVTGFADSMQFTPASFGVLSKV